VLPDGVPLAPMQQGQVTEVLVYEGQTVHKGDILLRVDDEAAQLTVALAEKGVRIAQAKLDEARQGPERYRHALDAQQAAVDSAKAQVASAEFTVRRLEALKEMTNANELAAAHEKVNALKAAVTAEEAQLRALQADRPEPKVQQAEGNLALAQEQVNAARLQLKKCVLEAPDNGTILRINSAKGSLITSQTRLPPIQFAPAGPRVIRAEVPQEFAHRIQVGMPALIHDVAIPDFSWQGTVKNLAPAYLPKRSAGTEMLSLSGNDAWVLECIVELAPTATPPRLNQRVRVGIGTQRTP
jgi:multidrug resistance efflux pump